MDGGLSPKSSADPLPLLSLSWALVQVSRDCNAKTLFLISKFICVTEGDDVLEDRKQLIKIK